jgi:Mg-chelatase subunit ChlD
MNAFKKIIIALWISGLLAQLAVAEDPTSPRLAVEGADGEVRSGDYSLKIVGLDTSTWPAVRLDFSVTNRANERFDGLRASQVTARHDGEPVSIGNGDLKLKRGGPSSVLLVLDASWSMVGRGPQISKLGAARGALITFVEKLGPDDRVGFAVFDEAPRVLVQPTANRTVLNDAIAMFYPSAKTSRYTRLYDALEFAIGEAAKQRLENVIVMSDGWEDTEESRQMMRVPAAWAARKHEREQAIAAASRRTGVRLFTVAIGDRNGQGLAYVDYDALEAVTRGVDGGSCDYVDIPELAREAKGDLDRYRTLFMQKLAGVFEKIGRSLRYDYSLTLALADGGRDDREHSINLEFAVGNQVLPAVVTYTWRGVQNEPPVVTSTRILPGILVAAPRAEATRPRLALILVALLALVGLMAAAPGIGRSLWAAVLPKGQPNVVTTVSARSKHVGAECPNEQSGFGGQFKIKAGDAVVACPGCGRVHHLACWQMNKNACWNRTCEYEAEVPANVARLYQGGGQTV